MGEGGRDKGRGRGERTKGGRGRGGNGRGWEGRGGEEGSKGGEKYSDHYIINFDVI